MSEVPKPHSDLLSALERLYVNVRVEYPFGVRDWEIVKDGIAGLVEQIKQCRRERDDFEQRLHDYQTGRL